MFHRIFYQMSQYGVIEFSKILTTIGTIDNIKNVYVFQKRRLEYQDFYKYIFYI